MTRIVVALLMGLALVVSVSAIAWAEDVKCEGTIAKIEGANVTVKAATESHTMTVADTTKITVNGSAAKLSDLKVGQKVKATCSKEGTKLTCTSIEATSA
jgi:Cu/Ag efflux protein CusF